jgi:hypothetical protein
MQWASLYLAPRLAFRVPNLMQWPALVVITEQERGNAEWRNKNYQSALSNATPFSPALHA